MSSRAGELEHLAVDRVRGRREDPAGDVDLVEDAWRRSTVPAIVVRSSICPAIESTRVAASSARPTAVPICWMLESAPSTVVGIAHEHRDAGAAELLDRRALGQPGSAGNDEVRARARRSSRHRRPRTSRRPAPRRLPTGKLATSSTLPTTRSPAPMAKSVSVVAGVSETIFRGSAGIATVGAFVVGEGEGERRSRGWRCLGRNAGSRSGAGRRLWAGPWTPGRSRQAAAMELRRGSRAGRESRRNVGGARRWIACGAYPFSRRSEQPLRVGDRTSIASDGHRSGTVPDSHRLRERAVCRRGDDDRRLALPRRRGLGRRRRSDTPISRR